MTKDDTSSNPIYPAIQLRQESPRDGATPTGNFAHVYVGTLTLTFSYETVIALAIPGVGRIGTKQRWSSTTSKHQRAAGPYRFELEPNVFDAVVAAVQVGMAADQPEAACGLMLEWATADGDAEFFADELARWGIEPTPGRGGDWEITGDPSDPAFVNPGAAL